MTGALWYLIWRTVRNRLARQIARLKNPRYIIALLIGIGFLWLMFFSPTGTPTTGPRAEATRRRLAGSFGTAGALYFAIVWIWAWWRENSSLALAFQPAEVHTLFAAPLSRRVLLGYKLVRSQLFVLFNALIWMGFLKRWGVGIDAPLRFVTAWALFSVFSFHRFAVALVRVPPVQGARRMILAVARALSIGMALVLTVGVLPPLLRTLSENPRQLLPVVGAALDRAPAMYALAPFRLILAPLFAPSPTEWVPAIGNVLLIVAVLALYVFTADVEFEETAAQASAELAKRFEAFRRGVSAPESRRKAKSSRHWLPLAPRGHPAMAIVWKNTMAWARYGGIRTAVFVVALTLTSTAVFSAVPAGNAEDREIIAFISLMPLVMVFTMSIVIGPRMLRNDLRQDLTSLSMLKTYPLPSSQIMLAEIASPALALTLFQLSQIAAAYLLMPAVLRVKLGNAPVLLIAVLAPLLLLAINAASLAIQNATVMLFPGWSRLGPGEAGLEVIGQNLLVTMGQLIVLVVGLVPALALSAGVFLAARALGVETAIAAAVVTGSLVLIAGVVLLALALGAAFERTEPAAVV